jgi:hypothetical protein
MDSLITAAARELAAGDPLAALKCVGAPAERRARLRPERGGRPGEVRRR